ncbi:MAG: hypothetical protein IT440_02295 [Phycisphaeraceae bacterium]|nr:hypothetical protein [Phycisphaeraceae bacterium]
MDLTTAILCDHAREQIAFRGLTEAQVRAVLAHPDAIHPVRPGRIVVQVVLPMGNPPRSFLLRVFIDVDRTPPEVVPVYLTSKISKYRSQP